MNSKVFYKQAHKWAIYDYITVDSCWSYFTVIYLDFLQKTQASNVQQITLRWN